MQLEKKDYFDPVSQKYHPLDAPVKTLNGSYVSLGEALDKEKRQKRTTDHHAAPAELDLPDWLLRLQNQGKKIPNLSPEQERIIADCQQKIDQLREAVGGVDFENTIGPMLSKTIKIAASTEPYLLQQAKAGIYQGSLLHIHSLKRDLTIYTPIEVKRNTQQIAHSILQTVCSANQGETPTLTPLMLEAVINYSLEKREKPQKPKPISLAECEQSLKALSLLTPYIQDENAVRAIADEELELAGVSQNTREKITAHLLEEAGTSTRAAYLPILGPVEDGQQTLPLLKGPAAATEKASITPTSPSTRALTPLETTQQEIQTITTDFADHLSQRKVNSVLGFLQDTVSLREVLGHQLWKELNMPKKIRTVIRTTVAEGRRDPHSNEGIIHAKNRHQLGFSQPEHLEKLGKTLAQAEEAARQIGGQALSRKVLHHLDWIKTRSFQFETTARTLGRTVEEDVIGATTILAAHIPPGHPQLSTASDKDCPTERPQTIATTGFDITKSPESQGVNASTLVKTPGGREMLFRHYRALEDPKRKTMP